MSETKDNGQQHYSTTSSRKRKRPERGQQIVRNLERLDCILGRESLNAYYEGNVRLDECINSRMDDYIRAPNRAQKTRIIQEIHSAFTLTGRFVMRDSANRFYTLLSAGEAKARISYMIRYKKRKMTRDESESDPHVAHASLSPAGGFAEAAPVVKAESSNTMNVGSGTMLQPQPQANYLLAFGSRTTESVGLDAQFRLAPASATTEGFSPSPTCSPPSMKPVSQDDFAPIRKHSLIADPDHPMPAPIMDLAQVPPIPASAEEAAEPTIPLLPSEGADLYSSNLTMTSSKEQSTSASYLPWFPTMQDTTTESLIVDQSAFSTTTRNVSQDQQSQRHFDHHNQQQLHHHHQQALLDDYHPHQQQEQEHEPELEPIPIQAKIDAPLPRRTGTKMAAAATRDELFSDSVLGSVLGNLFDPPPANSRK